MTNEERAALVEWLRQEAKYEYSIVSPEKTNQTADQIEADGKRIVELEIEAQAQYHRGYYDGHVAALGETQ